MGRYTFTAEEAARGRAVGASAGGKALKDKPAPADCEHCRKAGYDSWMQHLGHIGFTAYLYGKGHTNREYPMARANRTSIRKKLRATVRSR